jgi:hypothetical protein
MAHALTVRDIESIVRSVLRDYGLGMTLDSVAPHEDGWEIVLRSSPAETVSLTLGPNSPHGLRRALMEALEIDA